MNRSGFDNAPHNQPTTSRIDNRNGLSEKGRLDNNGADDEANSGLSLVRNACQQFESEWSAGKPPNLSEFLTDAPRALHDLLVGRLLRLDLRHRAALGVSLHPDAYHNIFPEHADLVDSIFDEFHFASALDTVDWSVATTPNSTSSTNRFAPGVDFGRFQLKSHLGSGGFGAVYSAYDPQLERDVALKFPSTGSGPDDVDVQRFLREAKSAAQLRHPYIVPVFEAGKIDGMYFIASGLVAGETLRSLIHRRHRLPPREAAQLVSKIASALHYAHNKGIIHRDIKPENIMIDSAGDPHVLDFGLARREHVDELLTQDGARMGTPAYMSPEQASGQSHLADARSDIWAIGVVFYELLTGTRPFQGNGWQVVTQIIESEPTPLRKVHGEVPADLEAVCLKTLEKVPNNRYASGQHFVDELNRWLDRRPVEARQLTSLERLRRTCRRNPIVASLTLAVALVLLIGSVVSTYFAIRADSNAAQAGREQRRANHKAKEAKTSEHLMRVQAGIADERAADAWENMYGANMVLAELAWNDGNIRRVDELLAPFRTTQLKLPDPRHFEWHFQDQLLRREIVTLNHPEDVTAFQYGPSGGRCATAAGKQIYVWNALSGELLTTLTNNHRANERAEPTIVSLSFDSDERQLAYGTWDGFIVVWDIESQQEVKRIEGAGLPIFSLATTPAGWRAARYNFPKQELEIVDVLNEEVIQRIPAPQRPHKVLLGGGGTQLAVGGTGTISVWDVETGESDGPLSPTQGGFPVVHLSFANSGKLLSAVFNNNTCLQWDLAEKKQLFTGSGQKQAVRCLASLPNTNTWIGGDSGGSIHVWETNATAPAVIFPAHYEEIRDIAMSPDGWRMASVGQDRAVKMWTMSTRHDHYARQQPRRKGRLRSLRFSATDHEITTTCDLFAVTWDVETGLPIDSEKRTPRQSRNLTGTVFVDSPSNTRDETILLTVRDAVGTVIREIEVPNHQGHALAASDDGAWLVRGTSTLSGPGLRVPSRLSIWNLTTGEERVLSGGHDGTIYAVTFSRDGQFFATGGDDETVRLWRVSDGVSLRVMRGHTKAVKALAFHPDGLRLASTGPDKTIRFWDTVRGRELYVLRDTPSEIGALAFSHDGNTLAGAGQRELLLWQAQPANRDVREAIGLLASFARDPLERDFSQKVNAYPLARPNVKREALRLSDVYQKSARHLLAAGVVDSTFHRLLLVEDVRAAVTAQAALPPDIREIALGLVDSVDDQQPFHATTMEMAARTIVLNQHNSPEEYQRALRLATAACDAAAYGSRLIVLAGAHYRCGDYKMTLKTLENAGIRDVVIVGDIAIGFQALAHYELGQESAARDALSVLGKRLEQRKNKLGLVLYEEATAKINSKPAEDASQPK